ncbi:MAG: CBS domain-containing protein [Acidobacteria bacterium]|nr:CBS domain-containing protein [Acidobacteriota bacterium]
MILVENVMTRDVEACGPEDTLAAAASVMWRRDCGVVPVVDEERRIVGIVTDRDICMALATRPQVASEVRVAEVMSREVRSCNAVDDIQEALETMRRERLRRLPVLDGGGKLAGVLSTSDIVLHSDHGKSKRHVSHREAMSLLKAISQPHEATEEKP